MSQPSDKPVSHRHPAAAFRPGTLWSKMRARTQCALACGALHTIDTRQQFIDDRGVQFVVRVISNLARKHADKRQQRNRAGHASDDINPFLPPAADLFVTNISPTHAAVLNKFNVIDHHLLIVTREFEHQETLLTEVDFEALWLCLNEFDSLGFYNGGMVAGASQLHKHLQLVPLPLVEQGARIPVAAVFDPTATFGQITHSVRLPFQHVFVRLKASVGSDRNAANGLWHLYRRMLDVAGVEDIQRDNHSYQGSAYNLLVTREWMLLVPRSKECFGVISINALGYAGSLFVKNESQVEVIRQYGPMAMLTDVGYPA